ncbi:MAG: TspO/MBR family protein [Raoultibacter sp.]
MQNEAHEPQRETVSQREEGPRGSASSRRRERRDVSATTSKLPGLITPEIIVVWVAFAAMVACNALFEALKLGGVTSADVSNAVFTWFTPAGYVFSIWGIIYIGLAFWLVLFTRSVDSRKGFFGLPFSLEGALFVVSCVLNVMWLIAWHLQVFPLSVVVILCLLVCVAFLYMEVRRRAGAWYEWAPISLYVAWLCVATVANIASVATRQAMGDIVLVSAISTVVLVALVWVLAFVMYRGLGDFVFGLVVLWATIGIGVHLMDTATVVSVLVIALSTLAAFFVYFPWQRFVANKGGRIGNLR